MNKILVHGNANGFNLMNEPGEETATFNSTNSGYVNIYAPNYKFHTFLNGSIQLQVLVPNDPSKCYRYFQDKKTHRCLKCKSKNYHNTASLQKDSNGIECIKMKASHICQPSTYYSSQVVRYSNFEDYTDELGSETFIFVDDAKSLYYRFYYDKQKNYYVCQQCNTLKKLTEAIVKVENGIKFVEAESVHACQPQPYIKKIKAPRYMICEGGRKLIVFAFNDQNICYQYSWDKKRKAYICLGCSKKGKCIKAKVWTEPESDEKFVQLYDAHECLPIPLT